MVVVVFIVCEMPTVAVRICYMLHVYVGVPISISALRYANAVGNLMLTVNSSVNVVIYCFMGRQFRAILLRAIRCAAGERSSSSASRNPVDSGRPAVPLHHAPTSPPPDHALSEQESSTSHHSAICRVDVHADDVHEMTFEKELHTSGVGHASTH